MTGTILNLLLVVPFLIMAYFLSQRKGAFLIAGYNTMPREEKAKYDEIALCKFMSKVLYGISFSIVLLSLSDWLELPLLMWIGIAFMTGLIVFTLIYSNTGNRFRNS